MENTLRNTQIKLEFNPIKCCFNVTMTLNEKFRKPFKSKNIDLNHSNPANSDEYICLKDYTFLSKNIFKQLNTQNRVKIYWFYTTEICLEIGEDFSYLTNLPIQFINKQKDKPKQFPLSIK
jgi:hypothetical protein